MICIFGYFSVSLEDSMQVEIILPLFVLNTGSIAYSVNLISDTATLFKNILSVFSTLILSLFIGFACVMFDPTNIGLLIFTVTLGGVSISRINHHIQENNNIIEEGEEGSWEPLEEGEDNEGGNEEGV